MMVNDTNYTRIKDFGTHYTCEGKVASFQKNITLSCSSNKNNVILWACSEEERTSMVSLPDSTHSFFYLHLSFVQDFGFLVPFALFEAEVLVTTNDNPSQISTNGWVKTLPSEILKPNGHGKSSFSAQKYNFTIIFEEDEQVKQQTNSLFRANLSQYFSSSIWIDVDFDASKYTSTRIFLHEDFPSNL